MTRAAPTDDYVMLDGLRFHYREWLNPGKQAM